MLPFHGMSNLGALLLNVRCTSRCQPSLAGALQAPAAEASVSSRIRASSSALQLEKVRLSARRHKLHRLFEQQGQAGQSLALASASGHFSSAPPQAPAESDPPAPFPIQDAAHLTFDGSAIAAARKRNLQVPTVLFSC